MDQVIRHFLWLIAYSWQMIIDRTIARSFQSKALLEYLKFLKFFHTHVEARDDSQYDSDIVLSHIGMIFESWFIYTIGMTSNSHEVVRWIRRRYAPHFNTFSYGKRGRERKDSYSRNLPWAEASFAFNEREFCVLWTRVLRSMNATENFDFISKNYKSQTIIEDDYHVISSLSMEYWEQHLTPNSSHRYKRGRER